MTSVTGPRPGAMAADDMLLAAFGRIAGDCGMCALDEHEDCVSAGELGALDVCGCFCHDW